jgi:hypothetical protein
MDGMSPGLRFPGTQDQGLRFLGLKSPGDLYSRGLNPPGTYTPGDFISFHTCVKMLTDVYTVEPYKIAILYY